MGNVIDAIINRQSCKKYTAQPVSKSDIDAICKAGTYRASGMNRQSPIILAITNKEIRDDLSKLNAEILGAKSDPFYGAPAVIVVLADKNVPTYLYDGSIVMANMMLAAEDLGLGACWIHRAKQEFETEYGKKLLEKLGIDGDYEGIGNLIVGYRDGEKGEAKPRKENYVYSLD